MFDPRRLLALLAVSAGCGSSSGGAGGDGGPVDAAAAPDAGTGALVPNPIVSRGKPTASAQPGAATVVDGHYKNDSWQGGHPSVASPSSVAIEIGAGYQRLLLSWNAGGSYNYLETDYGSPLDYHIDVSGDSTDGADGTWTPVATVADNTVRTRAHAFDFAGKTWVRLVVTAAPAVSPNGVQIDEIDVHDVSAGVADTWFFLGDSITAFWADRSDQSPTHQPSFAAGIALAHPSFFPLMIDGGIGGEKSDEGVGHIDAWLALNPDCMYWGIGYGTNDAAGNTSSTVTFAANMQIIIDHVVAAGRIPVLARIPYATDGQHDFLPAFNDVIDDLVATNGLRPGPDFYAWFLAHPDELRDQIHPSDAGIVSMNRLWTEAMDGLYP
jgi:lysophospholipase L1-like esterase